MKNFPLKYKLELGKGRSIVKTFNWWKIPSGYKLVIDISKVDYDHHSSGMSTDKQNWSGVSLTHGQQNKYGRDNYESIWVLMPPNTRLIADYHSDQIDLYILPEKQKFIKRIKRRKNAKS
jgi:hypothetical protein